jgi:hypothetical protein
MTEKCVKGYLVASVVERVRVALDQGRIGRDHVEVVLGSHAALVDEKIDPFRWYPVEVLAGLNRLLAKAKGGHQRTAMLELGAEQFELLSAMGVHQQLSFSEGKLSGSSPGDIGRWGRLVSTMIRSVHNFSEASFEVDPAHPECFHLDWRGIEALDDIVLESMLGFMVALARRSSGGDPRVTLQRPTPGHARFVFDGLLGRAGGMEREKAR